MYFLGRRLNISVPFADIEVCFARNHPSLCSRSDPQACAVELEYEAFRTSKMANSYKATVLKKVGPYICWCSLECAVASARGHIG